VTGGNRSFTGIDTRQWRDRANQLNGDLQDVRRQLQRSGAEQRDLQAIDEVMRALRAMGDERAQTDFAGLKDLSAAALETLQKLELDLRKRTDPTSNELYLSGADQAPPKYRSQVDDYYRELSKKAGK
jgi:hypothetical protein